MRITLTHTHTLGSRLGRWLGGAALVLLGASSAHAQLAGTKTIPGSYATVAAAIADLNTQGVGTGGVTFNVAAGYSETFASPTAGAITATGTAANPIIFQKSGSGANPVLTAGAGTSTTVDAIISLAGSDYVTFNGLDVTETALNTTPTTQAEFGYALFRASATDGAQNNTIRNCVVTLNKTNTATIGINGAATTAAGTATTASATSGANSGNRVYGNVVTNVLTGVYFTASSSTTVANYDQNNEIGSIVSPATTATGNVIGNFGGATTGYGTGGTYQNGLKIQGNTLNSTLNYTSATASTAVAASTVTSALYAVYTPSGTSSSLDIVNNTITLASGGTTSSLYGVYNGMGSTPTTNTVNITGNTLSLSYATATSATVYAFYNVGSPATLNYSNNTFSNFAMPGTGGLYLLYNSNSALVNNVVGNQITNITRSGTSGTTYGYYNFGGGSGTQTLTNNLISNITISGSGYLYSYYCGSATETQQWSNNQLTNISATTGATGGIYGIYSSSGASGSQIYNNTVTGLSCGGPIYGMYIGNSGNIAAYGNTIGNLSTTAASVIYGLYTFATSPTIYRNKIYGLAGSAAGSTIYGVYVSSGTTITLHNNLIGDLTAPAATSLTAVSGIYVGGGTTVNAYYNTINLAATSTGATFGTSGIYLNSTTTVLDLRNNIVVNKSTAAGTGGYTVALRRTGGTAGTVPANLANTINNNLYYAGTPSATNLIYAEGTTTQTNAQQTLAAYKIFMGGRDNGAVSEDVPFVSTTGTAATFLHISTTTPTQVESAGAPVAGITTDFDGDTRSTTTPDIGADEGTFQILDLTAPAITYTALGNTALTTNRTLTVTITDATGVATGANAPRLFYRKGTTGTFVSVLATSVSGSSYTFTFDYSLIGGAVAPNVIQYYVAAQDVAATPNTGTNPGGGTYTTAPTTFNSYTIVPVLNGNYYVGTSAHTPAATYATITAAVADYNTKGLTGAVNFILIDPTYSTAETFPIVINANGDASATNVMTIKPEAGVNPTITGSVGTGALFKFNGADYVTIDGSNNGTTTQNLTITNTSGTTSGNAILWLTAASATDGVTYNTVKNTLLSGSSTTAPQIGVMVGGTTISTFPTTAGPASNNTFQNNQLVKASYGYFSYGQSASAPNLNNVVTGNVLGTSLTNGFSYVGMQFVNESGASVTKNTVAYVSSTGTANYGIFLSSNTSNMTVNANNIHDVIYTGTSGYGGHGIQVTSGVSNSNLVISNNFLSAMGGDGWSSLGNSSPVGIYLTATGQSGIKVVYNSINLLGSSTRTSTIITAALGIESGNTGLTVLNNILLNGFVNATSGSKAYAFYSNAPATAYTALDYNDYFATGTQAVLGYFSNNDQATLAALKTATTKDANSLVTDPVFQAVNDLHGPAAALNNVGTPVAGVTTDYDGDPRSTTTPDIGADEFTPQPIDIAASALVAPAQPNAVTGNCYGTAEAVTVQVRNAGTATLNFATNPLTVTVVITGPGTPGTLAPYTLSTGTLASGATQTVTLPSTANLSTLGVYSFNVTATVVGDGNANNNTLSVTPTVTVAAPVIGTLFPAAANVCGSGNTVLTLSNYSNGTVQYQTSTSATGPFTDIPGANSATYTTPVLTSNVYYRAQVRCGTNVFTSNVSALTVNNPVAASVVTPVTVCVGGSATLTATTVAGSTTAVRFFSTATGGTALASTTTGNTTTANTPNLSLSTTYYAESYTPSGGSEFTGKPSTSAPSGTSTGYGGLYFTALAPVTIQAVTVYRAANSVAGTATIVLYNGNTTSGTAVSTVTATVPANPTSTYAPAILTLNLPVPAAGAYTLALSSATPGLGYEYTNTATPTTAFPYTSPSGTIIINDGTVSGYYYFFYNWQVSVDCTVPTGRTPIQVNVTPQPTAYFTYPSTPLTCAGTGGTFTPVLATGATAGTFSLPAATGITINPTTGVVTATAAAAAGTYTVTNSVTTTCNSIVTTSASFVLSLPPTSTFSYAAGSYCQNGLDPTPAITGTLGGVFSSTTGLSLSPGTGAISLYNSTPGTYTVTYAITTPCGSSTSTSTVTITAQPTAGFTYLPNSGCTASTATIAPILLGGGVIGTFSVIPATGLTVNATTGVINLSGATAGTYTIVNTVAGAAGCGLSINSTTFTVNTAPAAPSLTASPNPTGGILLTSSVATGNQFYLNGVAIPGATNQTYLVNASTASGSYTVSVTNASGCSATSAAVPVTITATASAQAGTSLTLYPNPTRDGQLTLELSGYRETVALSVLNALGQKVYEGTITGSALGQKQALNLSALPSGIYLLQARTASGSIETRRIVRE